METFNLLSTDDVAKVRQELTGPERESTPPPRASTPPRTGARPDPLEPRAQSHARDRRGKAWAACCAARPTDEPAPREEGRARELPQEDPIARPRRRRASSDGAAERAASPERAYLPARASLPRMTQSCDWESSEHVRARRFGRQSPRSANAHELNFLMEATQALQTVADTMREIDFGDAGIVTPRRKAR